MVKEMSVFGIYYLSSVCVCVCIIDLGRKIKSIMEINILKISKFLKICFFWGAVM